MGLLIPYIVSTNQKTHCATINKAKYPLFLVHEDAAAFHILIFCSFIFSVNQTNYSTILNNLNKVFSSFWKPNVICKNVYGLKQIFISLNELFTCFKHE
jgi:hypothetical protein